MFNSKIGALALLLASFALAQSELSSPSTVLPIPGSSGAIQNYLDQNYLKFVEIGNVSTGILGRFTNLSNGNSLNIGGGTIYELKAGAATKTVWTFFDDGTGHGVM